MFLFLGDYKMTFVGENNSFSGKVSPNIWKNKFLNFPNVFPAKLSPLKIYEKSLGRRMWRHIQKPVEHPR